MLFDLRSRGRRRTVQVIYALLALIMLSGLLLVGVGTGSGGGLLNGLINNNSSGGSSGVVQSQAVTHDEKLTKENPSSASAWAQLVQDQYANYNVQTKVSTKKQVLGDVTAAYQRYLPLTQSPDPQTALLASKAYALLGNDSAATTAKQIWANANPTAASAFTCLYFAATAAKNTRIAALAEAKAIALSPKAQQFELTQQFKQYSAEAAEEAANC